MRFLEIKKGRGVYYDPNYRSPHINLSAALAEFHPTFNDLEELKRDCIENIQHIFDTEPKPKNDWVKEEVYKLRIEQMTRGYRKTIKLATAKQNHLMNPAKPRQGVTEDQIEAAKEVPLVDLIDGRVFKAGNRFTTHCPFHQERTPSFYIFPDNRYKCFGCGEYGDTIAFVMKRDGVDFKAAVNSLIR